MLLPELIWAAGSADASAVICCWCHNFSIAVAASCRWLQCVFSPAWHWLCLWFALSLPHMSCASCLLKWLLIDLPLHCCFHPRRCLAYDSSQNKSQSEHARAQRTANSTCTQCLPEHAERRSPHSWKWPKSQTKNIFLRFEATKMSKNPTEVKAPSKV